LRTLLALLVFAVAIWATIEVFGAIVTGEMNVYFTKVKRDAGAVFFWAVISVLGIVCLAGLMLAAGLLFNIV
jgi:hypothetical protein